MFQQSYPANFGNPAFGSAGNIHGNRPRIFVSCRRVKIKSVFFLKKWANPGLLLVYFWSFQTNNTIVTTNQCEKCPNVHPVYGTMIQTLDLLNMSRNP